MNIKKLTVILILVSVCVCACQPVYSEPVRIGVESRVEDNERSHYNRYVNFRPANGETVYLNPPRISWPYWPDFGNNWNEERHTFQFQVSSHKDMSEAVVDVDCDFNFYNTLPVLHEEKEWYWRVGYDVGTEKETWSPVRSFKISDDAQVWDRAALGSPNFAEFGHPRVLFNPENIEAIRRFAQTYPGSKAALDYMCGQAESILKKPWWNDFPATDTQPTPKQSFYTIAEDLVTVCFVWRMTGDDKYAGVKERAVTFAGYRPGGRASPEGLAPENALGESEEDATQADEFLALLFDWLYQDLNEQEREIMIDSLEWRVDHMMNSFAWRDSEGQVSSVSLSGCARSHQYEGSMVNSVCGLVLYEHSEIGRKWFDVMLNYIIGVTSAHGFDGAWNEGAGYGASKAKWLTNAS
ncbi:MAG: DUF4962 domain-containing protein, partial [Planctomycetota bacterium]